MQRSAARVHPTVNRYIEKMGNVQPLQGRRVSHERVWDGGHAFEARYAPHTLLPDHDHATHFFTYVLRGSYIERSSRSSCDCSCGAVIFHTAGESHSNQVGPAGTASLNVQIAPELWDDICGEDDIPECVHSGDIQWAALKVWREFHTDDGATRLAMTESVALLCSHLVEHRRHNVRGMSRRIDAATQYIAERGLDTPHLSEVAQYVQVHPMHLVKLFRKRFGYSMGEFVRRSRVAWACRELANRDRTISSIAAQAGFSDHAHFTRIFRRLTGVSPSWYRDHLP